jgi:hypothetical protein
VGVLTIYARRFSPALATLALTGAFAPIGSALAPGGATGRWSTPVQLAPCPSAGPPRVVFPSDAPSHATGRGALVWSAAARCAGAPGARIDAIAPGAGPAAALEPRSAAVVPLAPVGSLSVAGAPRGRIAIAGADPQRPGHELVVEGRAGGPFATLAPAGGGGSGVALATAYLGDLALLRPAGGALSLEVQRWFGGPPGPARLLGLPAHGAPPAPAAVALDYRSDALVAWARGGSVSATDVPAGRLARPTERLGPAGARAQIVTLLSDDGRGMVMWTEQAGASTSVWFDYSAPGPRFGAPRLLEHINDPGGRPPPAGAPKLIRLSSESVMAAWPAAEGGRWVVRTAPVDQHGVRTVDTIAAARGDALLDALAPGPRGDAVILLSEPEGAPDAGPALLAARGSEAGGRTIFAPLEAVAEDVPANNATVAIEPGSDRALAAWQGAGGAVFYSLRAPESPG